jgi:hypothetical protein
MGSEELTCHPLGIRYPSYSISFTAFLKPPKIGETILKVSCATLHEYFILARSSQVNNSPFCLLCAICSCSAIINHNQHTIHFSVFGKTINKSHIGVIYAAQVSSRENSVGCRVEE